MGGLFLVIQAVASVMGFRLARSITGSVHELFAGTERVRGGDFTQKIPIQSRDQLGELAESFNSMTASIEELLRHDDITIDTAGDGEEALRMLEAGTYDCAVLDLRLPDMTGFDLIERVQPSGRVIVLARHRVRREATAEFRRENCILAERARKCAFGEAEHPDGGEAQSCGTRDCPDIDRWLPVSTRMQSHRAQPRRDQCARFDSNHRVRNWIIGERREVRGQLVDDFQHLFWADDVRRREDPDPLPK